MTEPSDLELADKLCRIRKFFTDTGLVHPDNIPTLGALDDAAARLRQRSEDAERYRYWREYALDEESDMGLSEALALSETSQEFDAILDKERAARKAK